MSEQLYALVDGGGSDYGFLKGFFFDSDNLDALINRCVERKFNLSINFMPFVIKGKPIETWYGGVNND